MSSNVVSGVGALGQYFARNLLANTSFGLSTAGAKGILKSAGGSFVSSLPYGAGYSFGTYIGFPKNFQSKKDNKKQIYYLGMPYSRYGRYYSRYGGRRRYRRYSRYYRRYV